MSTLSALAQQEEHLFNVIKSERFQNMEGLGNEDPFFIFPYSPAATLEVAKLKRRITNRLANHGVTVREIDLYELSARILKDRGVWSRIIAAEPELDKNDFRELLQGMLDPENHIAPSIRHLLADGAFDVVFLTGVGEVFPYIRSHTVLNNLPTLAAGKPLLMFFPGTYEQSATLGSSLVLFGQLKDDQYYRAKNILEQEV